MPKAPAGVLLKISLPAGGGSRYPGARLVEQPSFRQRLALRLEGHPLLRTLVLDAAFLWAFVALVTVTVGLAVALPKVWRTSPEDFSRATVRVSLIDLVQSWSLARAARKAEAAGDYDQAILAWRGAVANNLADVRRHRSVLTHLRDVPEGRAEHVILTLFSSSWLLALTATNASDLELVMEVLEKYQVPAYALEILAASPHAHAPSLAPARARCLLAAGRTDEFLALWRTHAAAWGADPRQSLYYDAWKAGWDTGSASIEALLRLKAAVASPGNDGLAAARLLLLTCVRSGDVEGVALALKRLEEGRSASVSQHALYWRLLASVGRFDEAKEMARAYESRPRMPLDAAAYAAVLTALDLRDEALRFIETNLARFETHPAVWEVYFSILIDARRWNEIRRAAANARLATASFETARILAMFAEYRAEVGEGREHTADSLARQLGGAKILDNATALAIARTLIRDGRAGSALEVLKGKKADLHDVMAFWQVLFSAAIVVGDLEALSESTTECLRLAPNDPAALSNRAAMLIAIEDRPTEALEITFRLVTEYPQAAAFQINHAFALLLNHRVEEAWQVLQRLDPARLERQAASAFHLAMTDALHARGQYAEALEESGKVQPGLILPPQAERLQRLRRELQKRLGSI